MVSIRNTNKQQTQNTVNKIIKKPLKKSKVVNQSKKHLILNIIERIFKVSKKGVSEFISIQKDILREKGCRPEEIDLFQSQNGVSYLRHDSIICKKYLVDRKYHKSTGSLIGFKFIGFNKSVCYSRYVPQSIRKNVLIRYAFKCIWCGSRDRLEVDHKNGRYNSKTTSVCDFQILCKSCNDKKRQKCNNCRDTGCRYNVQQEISCTLYKSAYLIGNEKYNDKQGCKGCFLYDIEDFYKHHDD